MKMLFLLATVGLSTLANEVDYLIKYKSPANQTKALQQFYQAQVQANNFSDAPKVKVVADKWLKVQASEKMANDILQQQSQEIEYIQPDYKISLMHDFTVHDDAQRKQLTEYLNLHPEFTFGTKMGGDNPAIKLAASHSQGSDPLLNRQWGMIDIGAPKIWNLPTPNKEVIVAVIDTGVDYNHPDLIPNMWRNPGETGTDERGQDKATNRIDDDGNGYVDDVVGYDFANNDQFPYDKATSSFNLLIGIGKNPGHGTHCAGTIAAKINNSLGISGIVPNVKLMALKFISDKGGGSSSEAIRAIHYAVDNGAKVLNSSWGAEGENPSENEANIALREAIQYAQSKGVLFIAAAGNGRQGRGYDNDSDAKPGYPASYEYDNIISVAAIDSNDRLGAFSNWGQTTVDIAAPGVKIFSTTSGGKYSDVVIPFLANWDGTSMAAPHVAGAAALYWSYHPEMTAAQVKEAILSSAVKVPSLEGRVLTGGKLNLVGLMK